VRTATSSEHPYVRALAAAAVEQMRAMAPHEAAQMLEQLGKDAEELVRVAAGTAPLTVAPPWTGGAAARAR
jgi:hypothetical protein